MQNKKRKVNILDILIIVLVLLCIIGAALRIYNKSRDDKADSDMAIVSFLIQDVPSDTKDLIKEGERVHCVDYGGDLGTVAGSVVATNAVYYVEANGEIVKAESPINPETGEAYKIDVYGTLRCEGVWAKEKGFLVDGKNYIAPNMSLSLCFPKLDATALILDLEIKKE